MRCIAVIEAQRPGLDSAIIWERGGELIAYAYLNGRVKMTRPLAGADLDAALLEVQERFQINEAQLTRVHRWEQTAATTKRLAAPRTRW